jgi:hypothetical protein
MMDLNKHIVKNDDSKPFHSNGYARVANGDQFGAVSNISFNQRQQIEYNRRVICGYNRSAIGSQYNSISRVKPVASGIMGRGSLVKKPSLQQRNTSAGPRHFIEPPARRYNPYS